MTGPMPSRNATSTIPILREEVEALGRTYRHSLLEKDLRPLPPMLHGAFQVTLGADVLFLKTLHFADDRPYAFEERYINLEAAPAARDMTFEDVSANEWLVHNAPYSHGDISFFAVNADKTLSRKLDASTGAASSRWNASPGPAPCRSPHVRLIFAPGYRMRTEI